MPSIELHVWERSDESALRFVANSWVVLDKCEISQTAIFILYSSFLQLLNKINTTKFYIFNLLKKIIYSKNQK